MSGPLTREPLTADRALALLEEVVAERGPSTRYSDIDQRSTLVWGCRYFDAVDRSPLCYFDAVDRSPLCIVGHVLARAGFEPEEIVEKTSVMNQRLLMLQISRGAARILQAAQETQDAGGTWGEALVHAHNMAAALTGTLAT